MRKIKFRGKSLETDDWVYGYLADGNLICTWDNIRNAHEVLSTTVGQFTGLTDKNGNEIYEGDILAIEGIKYPRHYIVSWNTEKLMFCIGDTPLYALLEAGSTTMREYIVCGNIHDNPDLIEKGGEQ